MAVLSFSLGFAFFLLESCCCTCGFALTGTPIEAAVAAVALLILIGVSVESRSCVSNSSSTRRRQDLLPLCAIFFATSSTLSHWIPYFLHNRAQRRQSATVSGGPLSFFDGSLGVVVPGGTPGARRHCREDRVEQNLHWKPRFFSAAFSLSKAESSWSSATSSTSFELALCRLASFLPFLPS